MQRRALAVALHHASAREAFGARLIDKPLMRNVLADLAIEAEATTALGLYLAHCFDPHSSEADRLTGRLLTPASKLHACKRGPQFAAEAMEVLGGNGYVEDTDLARIYRELPLLSIWEGSGNVMCLDALRVMAREPEAVAAFRDRIRAAAGANAAYDAFIERLDALFRKPGEADGRRIAHGIALAAQAALLLEHAPTAVAETFCDTRLDPACDWGMSFGTLPDAAPVDAILHRAGCADA
jgi:putative acyl-CoA dehydrogenase